MKSVGTYEAYDREHSDEVITHTSGVLRFTVPGPPVPASRPRTVTKNGKVMTYIDRRSKDYEKHASLVARAAATMLWTKPPKDARIGLTLRVYRARRAGDLDNFTKQISDSITRAGNVWLDDRQVVSINAAMAVSRERPRVEVEIRVLEGGK